MSDKLTCLDVEQEGGMAKFHLAAIGDSLSQGFQNAAIHKTAWSFPAIVARALGLEVPLDFRVPSIPGPGLPLNLEDLLRVAHEELGDDVSVSEWILKFPRIAADYIDGVEDFYERKWSVGGAFRGVFHNLAIWGYTVRDGIALTPNRCRTVIEEEEGWIEDDFLGTPSAPMYRTALRVLDPGDDLMRGDETQLGNLRLLAEELAGRGETLDALILWLGANDCLGTVLELELRDMERAQGEIPRDPVERLAWNLSSKAQFSIDFAELVAEVDAALAGHLTRIFVGTVPHVTIPPITTGVGRFDGTYFDYYARFFVNQQNFVRPLHKALARKDARTIDARIDSFNAAIRKHVQQANARAKHAPPASRKSWTVVEIGDVLDRLAVKRQGLSDRPEQALIGYYARQGISDHPLLRLSPIPSILMLKVGPGGVRIGGGLFSLDGVHPSTIGYGLVAEVFLAAMQNAGIAAADPHRLPWPQVIANDALLQNPPRLWDDVCRNGSEHPTFWDLVFRVIA